MSNEQRYKALKRAYRRWVEKKKKIEEKIDKLIESSEEAVSQDDLYKDELYENDV